MFTDVGQPGRDLGGGSTKSTQPLSKAARGIPAWVADFSSCAKVIPPTDLISHTPWVPSEPVPERITPMARPPWSSARNGTGNPPAGAAACLRPRSQVKNSCARAMSALGGMM
jgi:hypothetical protein